MSIESRGQVECFPDLGTMIRVEAERIVAQAEEVIATRGRFLFALSGGSTPRPLYELLATSSFATRIKWPRVHVFFGDERCVPPDHPQSNYGMAHHALLDRVPLPPANVHRIHGEDEPEQAALAYENLLRTFFVNDTILPARGLDLALLGLGVDGHTASLFPGSAAIHEERRWVLPTALPQSTDFRVTLTAAFLNASHNVTFLVAGADKAERLKEVFETHSPEPLPAQLIQPKHGTLHWMVDAAAATHL